jgi:DNA polymerase-3 subunit alpha
VIRENKLNISPEEYREFLKNNPDVISPAGILSQTPIETEKTDIPTFTEDVEIKQEVSEVPFTHLHVHTQYSLLDGAASIPNLMRKAKEDGMEAVAITDHGNMFGVKLFHSEARKQGIKPIIGCEAYVARRGRLVKDEKIDGSGDHLILLAKSPSGYKNLIKMISLGWKEGFITSPELIKSFY